MSTDLLPFKTVNHSDFSSSTDIGRLIHGQKCYVTIRCYNHVGLSATRTSVGIPYIAESPNSISALVALDINAASLYEPRGHYQTNNDSISFHWAGFQDRAGVAHYEVKLEGDDLSATDWHSVGHYTRTTISGLAMKSDHQYTIAVRAVNYGGLQSNVTTVNFTIVDKPPTLTGIGAQR